ncbi:MAG: general secretion pathway protein GspB [Gammaproteobacteria bacterium]|nr:general secretion pathway protein GspB [Gammaproteobacteria bacterium]
MSLILDALRKSERSRQQTLTGQVSSAAPLRRTHLPVPWVTLIGILIIANAVALAVILWRNNATRTRVPAATSGVAVPLAAPRPEYRPDVRSLAAEAASSVPVPPASTAEAASSPALPVTVVQKSAASTAAAALTTAATNPPRAAVLDTLPLAFQQSLPPLHLDVHSYAQNPADRFVIINMRRYQAGDTLKEGPKVIEIVPDGVILEYRGQRFLLPRS